MISRLVFPVLLLFIMIPGFTVAQPVILSEGLVINLNPGNKIIGPDPVACSILIGEWKSPSAGEEFKLKNKTYGVWEKILADSSGWFIDDSMTNAYILLSYTSDKDKTVLLEAMGNTMVFVNGSPRSGNPYRYKDTYESWEPRFDYSQLPVNIKKGVNDFLFQCNRGVLKVKINPASEELVLNKEDLTVPDIIINREVDTYGGIPIINTTSKEVKNLFIKTWSDASQPVYHEIENLQPLSIYKTPFPVRLPIQKNTGILLLNIQVVQKTGQQEKVLTSGSVELRVVGPGENYKETFISRMDGSVQYFAVNPPLNLSGGPELFLSLHGAGVEAINQSGSYARKDRGYIVAPTNRRPYGFNWENWGRHDALEVLEISKKKFNIDPERVYLTGHSMGGHGTWHLGVHYPDKFAAIGPSAGWISIWSYRIKPDADSTETVKMLVRSSKQSDTYAFAENLKSKGVYIIHGSEDDNVPPSEAESMINVLKTFHNDYIYHEEPGAGHWWDNSDQPGVDCVDWSPMFDFFSRHSLQMVKEIDFTTANLAVSSGSYWVNIINQTEQQKLSGIKIKFEEEERKFTGTTENIEMLEIDVAAMPQGDFSVALDNQLISDIKSPADGKVCLVKHNNKWSLSEHYSFKNKYPGRCGNLREVLNNDVLFVYGTTGSNEENKWAFEKARYDAERLWYQGNGSIELVKDTDFDAGKYKDRNIILFGNPATNSAWSSLIKYPEIMVTKTEISLDSRVYKGEDIACLFILPRCDSDSASVAVVGGTGLEGMKLSGLPLYHHPYTNFPDIMVFNKNITDSDEEGMLFTGYFGNDWSIHKGEFIAK